MDDSDAQWDEGRAPSPAQRFWIIWQEVDTLYERYARSQGLSYTSLRILDEVWHAELAGLTCTQKLVCARTFLPKQTVNSVVAALARDDVVGLDELAEDRRAKAIRLTAAGRALCERVIVPEEEAEEEAFEQLTAEEREQFFSTLRRFADACRAKVEALARG